MIQFSRHILDNGLTVIFMIKFKCLSHIHSGRICYCFVIKDIGNAAVCQHFFKAVCKTKLMDSNSPDNLQLFCVSAHRERLSDC